MATENWQTGEQLERQQAAIAASTSSAHAIAPPPNPDKEYFAWQGLTGVGWFEQIKSALAAIGLLAIVGGVLRAVR